MQTISNTAAWNPIAHIAANVGTKTVILTDVSRTDVGISKNWLIVSSTRIWKWRSCSIQLRCVRIIRLLWIILKRSICLSRHSRWRLKMILRVSCHFLFGRALERCWALKIQKLGIWFMKNTHVLICWK